DAEAGYYPRSLIDTIPWREYAQAVPRLLADLPRTRARMGRGDFRELPENAAPDRYPGYYARNFHYQTDGYLGHTSAALYDLQVELLFGGTADAMPRPMVPPVVRPARARNASPAEPPELEREILAFPARFHEPYYTSYVKDDVGARVSQDGLRVTSPRLAFLTELVTAEKPAPGPAAPTNGRRRRWRPAAGR